MNGREYYEGMVALTDALAVIRDVPAADMLEIYETWGRRNDFKHREHPAFAPVIGDAIHPEDNLERDPNE